MSSDACNVEVSPSTDALAIVLSHDYSQFLNIDNSQESKMLQEAIDANLAILEEFCEVFETLRVESSYCYEHVIPLVQSRLPLLDQLCSKVDQLEKKVAIIKASVDKMEEAVTKAESTLDTSVSVKKLLGSWFSSSKSRRRNSVQDAFVPPSIFDSEKLFPEPKSN